jgi:hypothetical protein
VDPGLAAVDFIAELLPESGDHHGQRIMAGKPDGYGRTGLLRKETAR